MGQQSLGELCIRRFCRIYLQTNSQFSPLFELTSFDLVDQKQLWSKDLKGFEIYETSALSKSINMSVTDGKVTVYGKSMTDRFIEQIEPKTGALMSHKKEPIDDVREAVARH